MSKIIIHIIAAAIINLYEFEKGNIAPELLVLLVLLGFSYSMLINVLSNQRVKLALFAFGILFLIMFPQFIFLLPLLAPSAYFNFNKVSFIIFLPFFSNFHVLYLMLVGLMLLWDILLVSKDVEVANLKKEKYNLLDDVIRLSKSIDLLRIEKERDETMTLLDERNRISREIHDTAGHTLSAAILNLKALSLTTKEAETKGDLLALKETLEKGLQYAYRDRKKKKAEFRALWIQRINAAARIHGMSYSEFMGKINAKGIALNRKVLADMAMNHPEAFKAVVDSIK